MSPPDRYTCEETFRRLNDYLDRELSPAEIEAVEAHLETCVVCAAEFDFEASLIREVRAKVQRIPLPSDLMAKINHALNHVD